MSWPDQRSGFTDPAYYVAAASQGERQLRADFAQYRNLREIAPFAETPQEHARFTVEADSLAIQWGRHFNPGWRQIWRGLQSATAQWETRPEHAREMFDRIAADRTLGDFSVDEVTWRTLCQAREVTGHAGETIAGSIQDAHRHTPQPAAPEHGIGFDRGENPAPVADPDNPVWRTLGVPPGAPAQELATLEHIDVVLADTEQTLYEQEVAARVAARSMLLPPEVRNAAVHADYRESATRDTRHAGLLRQVQDLAAEHSSVADGFTDTDTTAHAQARINRLERLNFALSAARVDALEDGLTDEQIDRAYVLGRDGTYWSTEPADPRLGRLAQLGEQIHQARTESDFYLSRITELQQDLAYERGTGPSPFEPDTGPAATTADTGPPGASSAIGDAVTAALPPDTAPAWDPPTDTAPTTDPAPADTTRHLGDLLP